MRNATARPRRCSPRQRSWIIEVSSFFSSLMDWAMTLVIARQFGERIIVVSDTMVSNVDAPRPSIIPGELKSIVVHRYTSIAFAGSVNISIDAIKRARKALGESGGLQSAVAILQETSEKFRNTDYVCDFILTTHLGGAKIYQICNGVVQQPSEQCWIGNPDPLLEIEIAELKFANGLKQRGIPVNPEQTFTFGASTVLEAALNASVMVGGFIIQQLGSPWGHTYTSVGGVQLLENIQIGVPETANQLIDRQSGKREYKYNILAPGHRGAGVVGGYLEQAKLGYLYAPMILDHPKRFHPTNTEEMFASMNVIAEQLGGVLEEKRWDE